MAYHRKRLHASITGGVASGDTGILDGAVQQMRWYPDTVDTGQVGTIVLSVLPEASDSGSGWDVFSQASLNLGVGRTWAIRQPQHGSDGLPDPADTGAAFGVPIVGAFDKLRMKVTPADTGNVIAGDLYVWVAG